jgi:hypothetical protein
MRIINKSHHPVTTEMIKFLCVLIFLKCSLKQQYYYEDYNNLI